MPRIRLAIRSGWKTSKSSSFSPVDANRIGTPVTSRTESAAPPRASPSSLVSTTPVKPTPSRNASAVVTASWPIIASRTNSTSSGSTAVADLGGLAHQLLVDAEPAGGVDDDDVVVPGPGLRQAGGGDGDGVAGGRGRRNLGGAGMRGEHRDAGALAHDLQLADRTGTLQVAGHQQRCITLPPKPFGQFSGERRLAGTLQARQHDHRGRGLGERQRPGLAAEDADELLVDDLDDLLGRVQRTGDLCALGALLDAGDEGTYDRKRDIRLQQGQPDLTGGGVDVGVGQPPLATEPREGSGQPVGQGFKHVTSLT